MRIGDILVERGLISDEQREQILEAQRTDSSPFGKLAEMMFGVAPEAVEEAWADQYEAIAEHVDPRQYRPVDELLRVIDRRQAWQFGLLPIRREPHEVTICTTRGHLIRAVRYVGWKFAQPCVLVLAEPGHLGVALQRNYPLEGMTPETANFLDMREHPRLVG